MQLYILFLFILASAIKATSQWLQCGVGQYQNQSQSACQTCDSSCGDCFNLNQPSQDGKQFSCLICSSGYYYNGLSGNCEQSCPQNTRKNTKFMICDPCQVQNCSSCEQDTQTCDQCLINFILENNQCNIDSSLINEGTNSFTDFTKYINEMECTNLIDNSYYSIQNQISYSFFDDDLKYMYIFTPFNVYKYDTNSFNIVATGIFPYAGFIRDCGFYPPDTVNFYCAARPNFLIQYNRSTLANTLIATFSGLFPNFGGGAGTYQGRIYQKFQTGLVAALLPNGVEVFNFETGKVDKFAITGAQIRYFNYLEEVKGFVVYDIIKDIVYFKQNTATEYIFLKNQAGNFFGIAMINSDYFFLLLKYSGYVCSSSLLTKSTPSVLATDCIAQSFQPAAMKYMFPSLIKNLKTEQFLIFHQNNHGNLQIYDYSKGVQSIQLIYQSVNTTLNYQYVENKKFILLNYNSQLSTLIFNADNTYVEKFTPTLTQYIFHLSYGFQLLQDKIIIVNSRQALYIKYDFDITSDSTPLSNFETFLNGQKPVQEIRQIYGDEPLTNFDYVIKTYYDANQQLYILVKNYSIRLQYQKGNIFDQNEYLLQLDQNSSTIVESVYSDVQKKLVVITVTTQFIISIPDLKILKKNVFNLQAERFNMYIGSNKVVSAISDRDNYFQYLYTDISSNAVTVSQVYFTISDYFVSFDKVVLLNSTDFSVITLETSSKLKGTPSFKLTFTSNIYFQIGVTSYLALYNSANKPPQLSIFSMDATSFTTPYLTLDYPSSTIQSHVFDYYQSVYSLYTIQSDGIYTYELNASNQFIQKSFYASTSIKNLKAQSKIQGPQSFSKIIAYQSQYGVLIIDKVAKTFQFMKTSIILLGTPTLLLKQLLQEEVLILTSFTSTLVYSLVNNQYRIIAAIQQSCTTPRYLDSYEISCYLPLKNDTYIIPVYNLSPFKIQYTTTTINSLSWNESNNVIGVSFKNSMIKILDFNLQKESVISQFQAASGTVDIIFIDQVRETIIFTIDKTSLYSYKKGDANSKLLLSSTSSLLCLLVAQDKMAVVVQNIDTLYSINYVVANTIYFSENVVTVRGITPPGTIISYDRQGDYIFINYFKIRIIKYSITAGFKSFKNFSNVEILVNAQRTDGAIITFTSTYFQVLENDQFTVLSTTTYTTLVDQFNFFSVSKNYVFCQPTAVSQGYLVDINTLNIITINFTATLYGFDFDIANFKMGSLTTDNILTTFDLSNPNLISSFSLQEFSDDLLSNQSTSVTVLFRVIFDLDCALISQSSSIYIYSISKKQLIYVIRKQTTFSILNMWIINKNIILYYDANEINFYNLHAIINQQNRFYATRFKTQELQTYSNKLNNQLQLISNINTGQLKNYRVADGKLLAQNQPKRDFFLPLMMNKKLVTAFYTSNSIVIVKQYVILLLNSNNEITDSMYVQNMNAIAPITQSVINGNLIFLINMDLSIQQIDIKSKSSQVLSIQLNNLQFIVEFTDKSLIFQNNISLQKNYIMCFDKSTQAFTDLTDTLTSYNIPNLIKSFKKKTDSSIYVSTVDRFLYQFDFAQGCQFLKAPIKVINDAVSLYFYDPTFSYLLVERNEGILEIFQNDSLTLTPIRLPYSTQNKMKISDDSQFYIFYSDIFIQIYTSVDLKLKVSIQQLFTTSQIQDVFMISPNILVVASYSEILSFYIEQNQFYLSFTYNIEFPIIVSYKIRNAYQQQAQVIFADLFIYSMQGFITLNLPIFQQISSSSKNCFYKLNLDSQNLTNNPVVSDLISKLKFVNQKSKNIQNIETVIFNVGDNENLKKLSTIPQQINHLILDSIDSKQYSKIIVDQYFQTISSVSQNIYLRNSNLIFQENNGNIQVSQPNIQINGKKIVFFQNITLDGYRKDYYFSFNQNQNFGIENLSIKNLQFLSSQQQVVNSNAFFNFKDTQTISIKSLIIDSTSFPSKLILFSIQNAVKVTIEKLTVQNVNCQDLILFSISNSIEVNILQTNFNNINCPNLQVVSSQLSTTISIDNLVLSSIITTPNQPIININAIQSFQINNLQVNKCEGINFLNISKHIQNDIIHTVLGVKIQSLKITQSSDFGILSSAKRQLQSAPIQNQMILISDCTNLDLSDITFDGIQMSSSRFITFQSEQIKINKLITNNIQSVKSLSSLIYLEGKQADINDFQFTQSTNINIIFKSFDSINLEKVTLNNNKLQFQTQTAGIISIIDSNKLNLSGSSFELNSIYKPSLGVIQMNSLQQFTIIDSVFKDNTASESPGTCLHITNEDLTNLIPSLIQDSQFISNQSLFEIGGAIYIFEQNVQIKNSVFIGNTALIGGAIKINSIQILPDFFKLYFKKNLNGNSFTDNYASLYGKNVGYFPQKMMLAYDGKNYDDGQVLNVQNFESNNYLDQLKITILDNEGEQVNFPTENLRYQNNNIQQEFLKYQLVINQKETDKLFISQYQIILNDYKYFQFNATLIMAPSSSSEIIVQSTGTVQKLNFNSLNEITTTQEYLDVQLSIESRNCQRGDFFSKINELTYCIPCPFGQYSLSTPDLLVNLKGSTCQNCPSSAISCQGSEIAIKNGFWREDSETDQIYKCKEDKSSCQAEEKVQKKLCGIGYVGPLCETCDTLGSDWGDRYARGTGNKCEKCSQNYIQILILLGFLLLTATYLVTIVFQNIRCSSNKIMKLYTERIIGISLGASYDFQKNSILIKILMNYFQIYILLDGSGFFMPQQANSFFFLGDPTITLITSTDCLLKPSSLSGLIYLPIALKLISLLILILISLIAIYLRFHFDSSKSKHITYMIGYGYMVLKVIFIYGSFGIVTDAVKALTCLQIGSKSYRLFDMRVECSRQRKDDASIYIFALFIVLTFSILMPLFLFFKIKSYTNKNQTQKLSVIKSYNFLFQEYSQRAAYWEVVKIMLKNCIIFVINFFEQDQVAKLQLAILFLTTYQILLVKIQPYKDKHFNNQDLLSMFTCQITMINTACVLSTNNLFIQTILTILSIIVNCVFLFGMGFQFMKGIALEADQTSSNPFKILLKKCLFKFQPILKLKLTSKRSQFKALQLWMKLKRRITGLQGNLYIESLYQQQREIKMSQKIAHSAQLKQSSDRVRNKPSDKNFKLDLYQSNSLQSSAQNSIKPMYYQKQDSIFQGYQRDNQIISGDFHSSGKPQNNQVLIRFESSENQQFHLSDTPFTLPDDIKGSPRELLQGQSSQKFQKNLYNKLNQNRCKAENLNREVDIERDREEDVVQSEESDYGIKMYSSQLCHKQQKQSDEIIE